MWRYTFRGIGTHDAAFAKQLDALSWVAKGEAGVIVLGETGTGKEVVAQSIHDESGREGPFVPVNCAAVSRQLLESELFGHVRGAFTGADTNRAGALASAHRGTLFLDEIADAPLSVQVALLRALEDGKVKPLGSDEVRQIDIRLVAATSQDLKSLITKKLFRQDLYYRLRGFELTLPPLRKRRADMPQLTQVLLDDLSPHNPKTVSPAGLEFLQAHELPGNVRQLRSILQTATALCPHSSVIGCKEIMTAAGEHMPAFIRGAGDPTPTPLDLSPVPPTRDEVEALALARRIAEAIRLRALGWFRTGERRLPQDLSRRATRADERLQLIYLLETYGYSALPSPIQVRARALFPPGWQQNEEGSAGRQVAKRLGCSWVDFELVMGEG